MISKGGGILIHNQKVKVFEVIMNDIANCSSSSVLLSGTVISSLSLLKPKLITIQENFKTENFKYSNFKSK